MKRILYIFLVLLLPFGARSQGFTDLSDSLGFEYSYTLGEYGGGASFVDFNQDGWDDISATSGFSAPLYFHENINGEDFQLMEGLIEDESEIKQILWVDYDNDGDLDLYLCSKLVNQLYKNTGDLNFENITSTCGFNDPPAQSFNAVWLDYDEDGLLDVFVSHRTSHLVGYLTLYHNLGDDQFEDVTAAAGLSGLGNSVLSMTTLDMNNDGWEDIYVGQDYEAGNLMLKNNGDGTFEDISGFSGTNALANSMSCTVGDYNNDGWMDIYVTNTSEGNYFYVNQGNETFLELSQSLGIFLEQFTWGAVFVDAENDGDQDLYIDGIINSFGTNSPMFMNPGDGGEFIEVNDLWGLEDENDSSIGNAIGDFNGDGFPDIFKINNGNPHTFWKNEFNENHFLSIQLEGVVSNSMAVGAVLEVISGDLHQYRRIGCGEGFSSQNSYTQFFGLGENTMVDSLIVTWPNGLVTTYTDIEADQYLSLIEIENQGCTDSLACNFDSEAITDDGSCVYPETFYNCEGNCENDMDEDGVCDELEILGCTDISACNFNSVATDNDGSCLFPEEFYDCEGNCLSDTDEDGVCDELEIAGCQEEYACNYNSEATDDDGSCYYVDAMEIAGLISPWYNTLYTYAYPETEGSSYEWAITNGIIDSGQGTSEIEVVWIEPGEGVLLVKETNEEGCEGTWVELEVGVTFTSIEENALESVLIYPNPVVGLLHLDFPENGSFPKSLEIMNTIGQVVFEDVLLERKNQVDLGGISSGMYLVLVDGLVVGVVSR